MFKVHADDSFGVTLSKNFAQSFIGTLVSVGGMMAGFATIGAVIDRRKTARNRRLDAEIAQNEK